MTLLVGATFIAVAGIVFGLYWLLVARVDKRASATVRKRLKRGVGVTAARRMGLEKEAEQLSAVGPLNTLLARSSALWRPLRSLIEQADSKFTVGMFLLTSVTAMALAYALVSVLTGYRGIGLLAGLLFLFVPYFYLSWKRTRRMLKFEEKFPEAIDLIARALRAGHAFTTGLGMAADEIPDPVGSEFKLLYDRQNFGMPLSDALHSFAERVPLLDARFFATAVLTQREAGGNLSEVLDNLSRVVRERFKVKRQIRVISAHARMTGWALVALPPATALGIMTVSPANAKVLVTDPLGIKMVIGAVILQVIGGMAVKKLVNIEY